MADADADRNLLYGIFALQNDLISREDLIAAFSAWVQDKSKRLDQILLDQKRLSPDDHALLEPLVRRHLKQHGDDPEKSLAAFGLAGGVREILAAVPDLDIEASLGHVGSSRRPDEPDAESTTDHQGRPVGPRYRVVRPHARGNLGLVSVALDAELHREVALKEIQREHADEPVSRARFLLEGEITGRLEHPGVVPVYGLGTSRDGRPYYAMRFVKGDTLEEALEAFHAADADPKRDPTERSLSLRKLLTRFTAVCEAMHYAHSRGVIHRDLKPANVLLGPYGETLVVDWGLAKVVGREDPSVSTEATIQPSSGSGSSETQTGAAVGTPAYMSPEQAEGKHDEVGPRSDVFGLGATLYAVVTGKAPLHGGNALDMLRLAQRGSFLHPRQVNPRVPKGLEAIVLKAMSFQPVDRYPTARALGEDLEHWLNDAPIAALPESWSQRAARWMRHHRAAARAAAVALLVITAVSIASALFIDQARRGERRALGQTKAALTAETRARHEADDQRKRAEEREELAINAVKKFRDAVAKNPDLKDREDLKSLRDTLLKEPQEFFKTLRDQLQSIRDTRPESLARLASALFDLAGTTYELGDKEDALRAFEDSRAILEQLARQHPTVSNYQRGLAQCHINLGVAQRATGRHAAAEASHLNALAILERLAREQPTITEYQRDMAHTHHNLGTLKHEMHRSTASEASYKQALVILERLAREHPTVTDYQYELARSHNDLGILQRDTDRPADALASVQNALAILERLAREHPTITEYQYELARSYDDLGILRRRADQFVAAERSYQRALEIQERLAREHPTVAEFLHKLALTHNNLGALQRVTRRPDAAEQSYQRALEIFERLAREHSTVTDYQSDLALSRHNLGNLYLLSLDQPAAAEKSYQRALEIRERLAREHPTVTEYQSDVGKTLNNLASIEMRHQNSWNSARRRLLQAIEHNRNALRAEPKSADHRQALRDSLRNLASTCLALWRPDEAAQAAQEQAKLMAGNPGEIYDTACFLSRCARMTTELMNADKTTDDKNEANTYAADAMTALRAAVAAGWSRADHTAHDPDLVPLHNRPDFRRLLAELFDRGFPREPFARAEP